MKSSKQIIFTAMFCFVAAASFAQFRGKDSLVVNECDCNKKLNNLLVNFTIPADIANYDLVSFDLYLGDQRLDNQLYYAHQYKAGQAVSIRILDPNGKATRGMFGEESGLFQGEMDKVDYFRVCEVMKKGTYNMQLKINGIKQVGTKVEYTYDKGANTVNANYKKIYDSGVKIGESKTIPVKQLDMK
jgi:hypothetical protein